MTIAFQGEIGAFSEDATRALYPDADIAPRASFEAVFESVATSDVDRAVIPIENSLFGSVHANYDLLREYDLLIVNEVHLRIRHHLMAPDGAKIGELRRVFSHPQALGQCREFLRTRVPDAELIPSYDTAGAAKMVAASGDPTSAAIASHSAAGEYRLTTLAAGIESNHQNFTRFLALARTADSSGPDSELKTSVLYAPRENVPGALFKSLAVFSLRDIDLFKIESRPLIGSPGQYIFYVDFAGDARNPRVHRALDHLGEIAADVKVLGSYPRGETVG